MNRRLLSDAGQYVRPVGQRTYRGVRTANMAESIICHVPSHDADYLDLDDLIQHGFVVVDKATGDKAVCHHPTATDDEINVMVASYFNSPAFRISKRVWMC